jgi:hypothetical protein
MAEPFEFARSFDLTEDFVSCNSIPKSPFAQLSDAINQNRTNIQEHPRTSAHGPREPDARTEVASRRQLHLASCSSVISYVAAAAAAAAAAVAVVVAVVVVVIC